MVAQAHGGTSPWWHKAVFHNEGAAQGLGVLKAYRATTNSFGTKSRPLNSLQVP